MSDDFCRTVSEERFSFRGCKDPFLVLYYPEVFAHSPPYAPYSSLFLGPFAELPVHHIIGLSERLAGCAVAIVVAPPRNLRVDLPYQRTSDSLLKMDMRAAHEWMRLKAACL